MPGNVLKGKKIALVIAFRNFRDIEYFIPRNILAGAGAQIITVSAQKGTAIGADGGEAEVNLTAAEAQAKDFDAVLFIGGSGMAKKLEDESFQKIARETVEAGKVLGAICVAPALLAKAGLLKGKKATVWSSQMDKSAVRILEEEGAKYLAETVVVDGQIVTAVGPPAAKQFGEKIVEVLTSR
jgi:protease I